MKAQMSERSFEFPSDYLGELRDCNDLIADLEALRARMEEDGYLLIRGLIDRQIVLNTRLAIVAKMAEENCLLPATDPMDAIINPEGRGSYMIDSRQPEIVGFLGSQPYLGFFERYYGEEVMMYPRILTRGKATGGRTGIHLDNVYIGRGSDRVLSCWTPFGDIDVEQGPLAICAGSHNLPGFEKLRQTYGKHEADRDRIKGAQNTGSHFSFDLVDITENFGGQWKTTNFGAGDVIIFPPFTLHCGLDNTTNRYRISSDTRFQPEADPVDDRWMVNIDKPSRKVDLGNSEASFTLMEEARAKWDL